jgi:hypothetical protein
MDPDDSGESPPDQVALVQTKEALLHFLREERPRSLFYLGQLQVLFEDRPIVDGRRGKKGPFHWITAKAAALLAAEGRIVSETSNVAGTGTPHSLRFFHSRSYRDWRMEARTIQEIVAQFSRPEFTVDVGNLLELLVDSAMASACGGFHLAARDVNEWKGRKWTKTNQNLDRIYVSREGIEYGCEVKNTLPYIERAEFENKLEMCSVLGIRPFFVARMMPESYVDEVWRAGGFSLLLKNQIYPMGAQTFAGRVREALGLPVACASSIASGDLSRFTTWHEKLVARRSKQA